MNFLCNDELSIPFRDFSYAIISIISFSLGVEILGVELALKNIWLYIDIIWYNRLKLSIKSQLFCCLS